jgi:hypothetical protein
MIMKYIPQVNDYVRWTTPLGKVIEGWVYFSDPDYYCTIEFLVKDKSEESYRDSPLHKKIHCLIVCYKLYWNELEFIKKRNSS